MLRDNTRRFDGGNLGPIPYLFPLYIAALAAILTMTAAELAAYIARRQKALSSRSNEQGLPDPASRGLACSPLLGALF